MADFKNLVVWQKAHKLSLATVGKLQDVRGNAGTLIRNQLLRSVLSIQANIAEGSSKRSDRDFARYVRISMGSATESENHMILLKDLLLIDQKTFNELNDQLAEVGKMLSSFQKRLTRDASSA